MILVAERAATAPVVVPRRTTWSGLRAFRRSRPAMIGGTIVAIEFVVALFSSVLAPFSAYDPVARPLLPPLSGPFLLGTDDLGRDVLSRILIGAPVSLLEGVVVVMLALTAAVPLGLLTAEVPVWDGVVMRVMDALLAFPSMLLALALVAVLGPGLSSVLLAVGISSTPPIVILVRATSRSVRQNDYVMAARASGASRSRVARLHILPNVTAPILVSATFRVAAAILISTGISFLGLGAQPPSPEWGSLLSNGRDLLYVAPHVATFPGLAIFITVLGFNLLGDGLRDILDPRLRV